MFPYLNEIQTSRDMIDVFYGYNANDRIKENEFADMKNMSSDKYPMLSPRKSRGLYRSDMPVSTGMIAKDDVICYVADKTFYIEYLDEQGDSKTVQVDMDLTEDSPKQLVSMGAYVIILPDKKYVNVRNTDDRGLIEQTNSITITATNPLRVAMCMEDGTEYTNNLEEGPSDDLIYNQAGIPIGIKTPTNPENGFYWIDSTDVENPMLKRWSSASSSWIPITTTYIKITREHIADGLSEGDGVVISGCVYEPLNGYKVVEKLSCKGKTDDYIVIKGKYTNVYLESSQNTFSISRTMPDLDFVCESGNRLWGCKYGKVGDQYINEIYASKLGDFKNWNCFEGISTDSYVVSCGSDGPFTAAVNYGGRPIFFKENCMHMIYGNYPAEYQMVNTLCRGVQQGCEKSLAIVNEVLFYKSRAGIMTFDGSLPMALPNVLGDSPFDKAIGCGFRNKYYVSMRNRDVAEYAFFVYDTTKGLWHKEDDLHPTWMCAVRDNVYYVDSKDTSSIQTLFSDLEENIEWSAVTGQLGLSYQDTKYISRIDIRAQMEQGSSLRVSINYDNENYWQMIFYKEGLRYDETKRCGTVSIPIRTRRCDHFRLKFEGKGNVNIISIGKTIEQGSSLRGGLIK